jgi:hypothetical protein
MKPSSVKPTIITTKPVVAELHKVFTMYAYRHIRVSYQEIVKTYRPMWFRLYFHDLNRRNNVQPFSMLFNSLQKMSRLRNMPLVQFHQIPLSTMRSHMVNIEMVKFFTSWMNHDSATSANRRIDLVIQTKLINDVLEEENGRVQCGLMVRAFLNGFFDKHFPNVPSACTEMVAAYLEPI